MSIFKSVFVVSMIFFPGSIVYAGAGSGCSPVIDLKSKITFNPSIIWNSAQVDTFVKKAAVGNLMEVLFGDTAAKKAVAQDVRNFGNLMVKDHGDAYQMLKTAVQNTGMKIPSVPGKQYLDQIGALSKLTGSEFDKEYIKLMVKDHALDLSEYETAAKFLPPGALKDWVNNTLSVIKEHLRTAKSIEASMNK